MTEVAKTDWAYIAGFVDGEGTIAIYPNGPRMVIANTNLEVLTWIVQVTGFGYIQENTKGERATKPCYLLSFGSTAIRDILPRLIPYLKVKRERAEDLMPYMDLCIKNSDPERMAKREKAYEAFREKWKGR